MADSPLLQPTTINMSGQGQLRKRSNVPKWCRPFSKDTMTPEERLNLNWLEKWLQHGRFPWKFIIHALLTVLCTLQVFLQTSDQTEFARSVDATWYRAFFPPEFEYQGDEGPNVWYIYTIPDCITAVQSALSNYESFPNTSVSQFMVPTGDNASMVALNVYSYQNCRDVFDTSQLHVNTDVVKHTYYLSSNNLGPFANQTQEDLRQFFYCMKHMTLDFTYTNVHLEYTHPLSYLFSVQLIFDNSIQGGRIDMRIKWSKKHQSNLTYFMSLRMDQVMVDAGVILLALVSQVLSWISIANSFSIFESTRRKLTGGGVGHLHWRNLPLRTKLRFFNMWFLITIIGNGCSIVAACMDFSITTASKAGSGEKFLLGFGTLLAWINMIRYLEFNKKYTVLISALQRGFPNTIRFIIGALPIFVGFALFGLAYFSESSARFSTFGDACITLFGVQNGDEVVATFKSTENELVVGRIYLYAFVFISIYGITNIFIAIMQDSYASSAKELKNNKKSSRAIMNRETDLNTDDQLWNAVLGYGMDGAESDSHQHKHSSDDVHHSSSNIADGIEEILRSLDEQHASIRADTEMKLRVLMTSLHQAQP